MIARRAARWPEAVAAFATGTGPVAVDAERASGYRYTQRAYLIQLRREGSGTAMIDPIACPDLSELAAALADTEWVLHAANQDLACLREVGLAPDLLFDTELGGRLAGYPRVGLGPMIEDLLGYHLEKGHSADDWSTRPLPEPWLRYAALDVELLVELRDKVGADLLAQGKLEWAMQEFAAVLAAPPPAPRSEPWRRTSGIHKIRRPRQLAVVRALWERRDMLADRRDMPPGRVLPDSAIIEAATRLPQTVHELRAVPGCTGRTRSADAVGYHAAVLAALELPEAQLPNRAGRAPTPRRPRSPGSAATLVRRPARPGLGPPRSRWPRSTGCRWRTCCSPDLLRRLC